MIKRLIKKLFLQKNVIYNNNFFGEQWFRGWEELSETLAALLESKQEWRSVLDFGCGPGIMIDKMTERGFTYIGCDYSPEARSLYLEHYGKHPDYYVKNLNDTKNHKYDLMITFDVFEHMRDDEIGELLNNLKEIPNFLFNISRTHGIPGHINIKSDRAWIAFMKKHGCQYDEKGTQQLRELYLQLRPGAPDHWNRNLFLFSREEL